MGRLADDAQRKLEASALPRSLRRSAASLLARVRRSHSYADARTAVGESAAEAALLTEFLARLDAQLARSQKARSVVEPFGAAWKELVSDEIRRSADHATRLWVRRYAEAFVLGRFDICVWLSGGSRAEERDSGGASPLLADWDLSRRMLVSARAAKERNLAASLPALETLTESEHAALLPPELSFRAWCMRVRAVARGVGDAARAKDMAEAALARARESRSPVPAEVFAALHAAHGECLLDTRDIDSATRAAERALRKGPREPAGHVLRGLIAESMGDFTGADESYEDAAEAAGARAISGELYAPVPPNLLWQHGRRLRRTDPRQAARIIREALRAGIRGDGPYPERTAYVDLANAIQRRLETATGALRQRLTVDAAEAYWQAGRRYAWIGDEVIAIDFLSMACKLDPTSRRYAFERAEALRIRAVYEDGTVDLALLREAADAWQQAYGLGAPGTEIPWAYITRALIAHEESGDLYRPRPSRSAVALLERGLLCDPDNVRTMAQLSQAHRLLGRRWTALELIEAASLRDGTDELVFDQRLLVLLELERSAEALDLIEAHGLQADQPWLVIRKVQILLTLGRPAEALTLLETVQPIDQALNELYLGLCRELLHDKAAAQKAYEAVAAGVGSAGSERRSNLSAWACYLIGRYDDAERAYAALVEQDPEDPSLRREWGQILMARGDETRGDVSTGRSLLISGIRATYSPWSLSALERIGLPRLVQRVGADSPHHTRAALEEIDAALRERKNELRRAVDAIAELEANAGDEPQPTVSEARHGGRLALARIKLSRGAVEEALERYVELVPDVPEATLGLRVAGERLRRSADEQADGGELEDALATYGRLLTLIERSPKPLFELTSAVHLRAALVALQLKRTNVFERHAVQAFPKDPGVEATSGVQDALAAIFDRPEQYWQVMDGARRLGNGAVDTELLSRADAASAGERLLAALAPAALLRADCSDLDPATLFPLVTPLTIRLGPGLFGDRKHAAKTLRKLVDQARRRVEKDTGVQIPGVDLQQLEDHTEPGAYEVELYETSTAHGTVPPDGHFIVEQLAAGSPGSPPPAADAPPLVDPLTRQRGRWINESGRPDADGSWTAEQFVVRHLEAVIRTHLPRLFDIDDVGIWLTSVPSGLEVIAGVDRLSIADRLEILRMLRLLLREQVPIRDAGTIFRVIHEAGPEWSAVDLLPTVRARLRSDLAPAAVRSARPAVLPMELETAFAAGYSPDDPERWQLPRPEAVDLAGRVAAWYGDQPSGGPVVVRDPQLRSYFWRLLAGLVPGPVWVLSQEEIDGLD